VSAPAIETLRRQLREKFPQAHAVRAEPEAGKPLDAFAFESFPAGAISEMVCDGRHSGLGLWISGLLGEPEGTGTHPELVLIDGSDAFDPGSFGPNACSRLLWVRCRAAREMLKSADLLARDGNVPFLLLDASGLSQREVRDCPASAWWRLKRIVEGNGCRLVVMAAFPIVPCSARRLRLLADLTLADFDRSSEELIRSLRVEDERLQRVN
jgi:hypothetical protein